MHLGVFVDRLLDSEEQPLAFENLNVFKKTFVIAIGKSPSSLSTKFLLDYPLPTVAGMKTVLDDLGAKNPKIRELKPEDLLDTRFLRNLKDSGAIK